MVMQILRDTHTLTQPLLKKQAESVGSGPNPQSKQKNARRYQCENAKREKPLRLIESRNQRERKRARHFIPDAIVVRSHHFEVVSTWWQVGISGKASCRCLAPLGIEAQQPITKRHLSRVGQT